MSKKEDFVKVILLTDEDGHNFIIPDFMEEDWNRMYDGIRDEDGRIRYDALDEFSLKFEPYRIDGGFSKEPIHVPLTWLEERKV